MMKICITYARGRLTQLIRDAAAGDDVVLTHNGVAVARLVAIKNRLGGSDPARFNPAGADDNNTTAALEQNDARRGAAQSS